MPLGYQNAEWIEKSTCTFRNSNRSCNGVFVCNTGNASDRQWLADVAGYMVIVYAVIIVEKYLLTITEFSHLKSYFLSDACFWLTEQLLEKIYLQNWNQKYHSEVFFCGDWFLPVHGVTNMVNETYAKSYD
ncbi:MAG: hypothetical protein ACLUD0_18935 [Eubacterium ramulus]